jgi:hypothetical protein
MRIKNLFLKWLEKEWRDITWDYSYDVNWECEHFCLFYGMLKYGEDIENYKVCIWKVDWLWEHYFIKYKWIYIDWTYQQFNKNVRSIIYSTTPTTSVRIEFSLKEYIDNQRAFMFYKNPLWLHN